MPGQSRSRFIKRSTKLPRGRSSTDKSSGIEIAPLPHHQNGKRICRPISAWETLSRACHMPFDKMVLPICRRQIHPPTLPPWMARAFVCRRSSMPGSERLQAWKGTIRLGIQHPSRFRSSLKTLQLRLDSGQSPFVTAAMFCTLQVQNQYLGRWWGTPPKACSIRKASSSAAR